MLRQLRIIAVAMLIAAPTFGQSANDTQHVTVTTRIERISTAEAELLVTAEIADGLHIYAQSQTKPFIASKFTIEIQNATLAGPLKSDRQPLLLAHKQLNVALHEFEGTVLWKARLNIHDPDQPVQVSGSLLAQACEEGRCYAPTTYPLSASLKEPGKGAMLVGSIETPTTNNVPADTVSTQITDSPAHQVENEFSLQSLDVEKSKEAQSAWVIIPLAFAAGFLLNFMPCVLPVVGLKLLSFVQQANSDRKRILLMNVAYTAGLQTVMLALASLAVFAGFGWGQQFSSAGFTITLAAIVFAFGLSFLGVWEIPLPGFVGTADGKMKQEGYGGAYSKGILSTLLATPCSGPFLGAALAWAVTQPGYITYAVFLAVGFGMASPYLVIGAFPGLVRFLPKPGNWMVGFKHIMGFVMLATVVYLMSFLPVANVVPCVLLLLGLGFALWYAGHTPIYKPAKEQLRTWAVASTMIAATAFVSFGWLNGVMEGRFQRAAERYLSTQLGSSSQQLKLVDTQAQGHGIAWQTYSPELLESLVREGRPVFVDFTADWCLTCKANEVSAIETQQFTQALRDSNAVALRADKTTDNPEADALLRQLGNSAASIPYYAFFHPHQPANPTILDGVFASADPFVKALEPKDRTAKVTMRQP